MFSCENKICFCSFYFLLLIFFLDACLELRVLLRMLSGRPLSYLKEKRKISRNDRSLSFVVTLCTTRCHLLSLFVIHYHSLSLVVIRCHLLSFVVTRCTTRCHSLSLVVIRCHSLYHSLSLVVTRCTPRLLFYKRSG